MSMFTLVFFQNGTELTLAQGTTIILIDRIFDAKAAYNFWIPRGTIVTTLTVAIGVGIVPVTIISPMPRKIQFKTDLCRLSNLRTAHKLFYAVFQSISQTLTFTFQTFLSKVNTAVATIVFGQNDFKTVDKSLLDIEGRQNMNQQN